MYLQRTKIQNLILTSIFALLVLSHIVSPIQSAESIPDGFVVSSPVVYVTPNESYSILIKNQSENPTNIKVIPYIFSLDIETGRATPSEPLENYDELFSIDKQNLELSPNMSSSIQVQYYSNYSDKQFILGVIFEESLPGEENLPIKSKPQIASIFYDRTLSQEDVQNVAVDFVVKPKIGIGKVQIGNQTIVSTYIYNRSGKVLSAQSGEISLENTNGERIKTRSITQNFTKSILGASTASNSTNFIDARPWWQRIGFVNFSQKININNVQFNSSTNLFVVPIEAIGIVVLTLIVTTGMVFVRKKFINHKKEVLQNLFQPLLQNFCNKL